MNRLKAAALLTFEVLLSSISLAQDTIVQATNLDTTEMYADKLYNRGIASFKNKDYKAAIGDFTVSLELRADFEPAYFNRANCKVEEGDLKGAIADFDKALN